MENLGDYLIIPKMNKFKDHGDIGHKLENDSFRCKAGNKKEKLLFDYDERKFTACILSRKKTNIQLSIAEFVAGYLAILEFELTTMRGI